MAVTIRSFIAVHLSDHVREEISKFQSELKRLGADVKWVRPESMHITLKFLGNVTEDQVVSIREIMHSIAQPEVPFEIAIRGVGCFPNEKRPRVLWLGIQSESTALANMANALNTALEKINFEREKRTFKPHLTLGRVKTLKNMDEVIQQMNAHGFDSEPFRIERIHLMKSQLKPTGAEYTVLE